MVFEPIGPALRRLALAGAMIAAPLAPALAQDAAASAGDAVLARVGEATITARDVDLALNSLPEDVAQGSAENRRAMVLDLLIDMTVLANAARAEGFDEGEDFETQMKYLGLQTLQEMYFGRVIEPRITEEALRARYEEEIGGIDPEPEVRARHILVESEAEAERLIEEIEGGADFAALAREHSIDTGSGAEGGDLGYFGRGQMVPPFEQAAFALEPGEVTDEPVESRFGFHVVKVEDRRERPLPSFEQVEDQLRRLVLRDVYLETIEDLKAETEIERTAAAPASASPEAPTAE